MRKVSPGALAALLASALIAAPAGAAAPANVTVRVEGEAQTLLPRSAVATTTAPVVKDGTNPCTGTSALGALDRAVAGDWAGYWGGAGFGYAVETIKGETHNDPFPADPAQYWSFWVNYRYQDQGLCGTELQEGDDVLMFVDCFSPTNACSGRIPLRIGDVPAAVAPGQSFSVRLEEFTTSYDAGTETTTTTPEPAEGATISAAGQTVTTGADGTAQLNFSAPGPVSIEAAKPGRVRTAALTCVTSGSDGSCGTQLPPSAVLGTEKSDDTMAPVVSISRLANGKVYKRGRGPRKLEGSVTPDPSGLLSVRLSILRKANGACWAFDGAGERFKRHRCGGSRSFRIGDRADWSYLLPKRLGRGRYTIRAAAIDKAGNDSTTQVVIRVR
jgi:hypothetical protein